MKASIKLISLFIICALSIGIKAQQTIGVFLHKDEALDGHTFFTPYLHNTSYLIDNCGFLINSWQSNFAPGITNKMLQNGHVLRTNKIPSAFDQTSAGGGIEIVDWNNKTIWSYDFSNDTIIQHHHVEDMPNGNLLVMAWEKVSPDEQIEMGRNPNRLIYPNMWIEAVFEIKPFGNNDIEIIWEWHLKDHLVQDHDSSKDNYGGIGENFGLVDMNYVNTGKRDLWHVNSIDYNESLDQILITSRENNEIWILDHSTNSIEASGHAGGFHGKGGDLIYRWGNPLSSDRGSNDNWKLFGCHGAYWIKDGLPNTGGILFFNNGDNRPQGSYSSVEILFPEMDSNGYYFLNEDEIYGPEEAILVYQNPGDFFSRYLSNAQQLPNGNFLINEGISGHIFEINALGEIVWDYVSPVDWNGTIPQGFRPNAPGIFRAFKFDRSHPAFSDKDIEPGELLEINSNYLNCILSNTEAAAIHEKLKAFYAMDSQTITVTDNDDAINWSLINSSGALAISRAHVSENVFQIDCSTLGEGVYTFVVSADNKIKLSKQFVVIH